MEAIPVSIALTQNTHNTDNTDTYYCTQSLLQTHWLHNRQIAGFVEPSDKLPLAEGGSSIKPIGANNFISIINHDGGELFCRYFFMMMKTMPWVFIYCPPYWEISLVHTDQDARNEMVPEDLFQTFYWEDQDKSLQSTWWVRKMGTTLFHNKIYWPWSALRVIVSVGPK